MLISEYQEEGFEPVLFIYAPSICRDKTMWSVVILVYLYESCRGFGSWECFNGKKPHRITIIKTILDVEGICSTAAFQDCDTSLYTYLKAL